MNRDLLAILEMGSERAVADLAVNVLETAPSRFPEVLALCFLEQYPLSMRAARVVQLFCEKHPESMYPYLEESIEKSVSSKIDGVKRNFLKIFSEFISQDHFSNPVPLLDACFRLLENPLEKPATRIHAMNFILRMAEKEPGLLHELKAVLEILGDEGEISIRNHVRRLRIRLYCGDL